MSTLEEYVSPPAYTEPAIEAASDPVSRILQSGELDTDSDSRAPPIDLPTTTIIELTQEGTRGSQSGSTPPTNQTDLREAVTVALTVFKRLGCIVLSRAHHQGLAAPAEMTADPTPAIFAAVDESLLEDVLHDVLTFVCSHGERFGESEIPSLVTASLLVIEREACRRLNVPPSAIAEEARWPAVTGQQTLTVTPWLLPIDSQTAPLLATPQIATPAWTLLGGAQQLVVDLPGPISLQEAALYRTALSLNRDSPGAYDPYRGCLDDLFGCTPGEVERALLRVGQAIPARQVSCSALEGRYFLSEAEANAVRKQDGMIQFGESTLC